MSFTGASGLRVLGFSGLGLGSELVVSEAQGSVYVQVYEWCKFFCIHSRPPTLNPKPSPEEAKLNLKP